MKIKKIFAIITIISILFSTACSNKNNGNSDSADSTTSRENPDYSMSEYSSSLGEANYLYVKKDKDFKILNFTDLHLYRKATDGYDGTVNKENGNGDIALALMKKTVEQENPDLITITGDFMHMNATEEQIKYVVDFMDSFGIYWAPVFGNHEFEQYENSYDGQLAVERFSKYYTSSEYCLFKRGIDAVDGTGNYVINIVNTNEKKDGSVEETLRYSMIMLDSHGYTEDNFGGWITSYLEYSQIKWYEDVINALKKIEGKNIRSMMFMHIPLPEYKDAHDSYVKSGFDKNIGNGLAGEKGSFSSHNSGMFDKIKELNSTTDIYCAHDHLNYYSVLYKGLNFHYCLKTGICADYGPTWYSKIDYSDPGYPDKFTDVNGYTLITIGTDNKVTTRNVFVK